MEMPEQNLTSDHSGDDVDQPLDDASADIDESMPFRQYSQSDLGR